MKPKETIFVIPTYRLRDVAATIEKYDENFRANGHAVKTDDHWMPEWSVHC